MRGAWSSDEIEFLKANYQGKTDRIIAEELGKSISSIRNKRDELKLRVDNEERWSPREGDRRYFRKFAGGNAQCRYCNVLLTNGNWRLNSDEGRQYICNTCLNANQRDRYARAGKYRDTGRQYRKKNRLKIAERKGKYNIKLKQDVLSHYSAELKCKRCRYTDIRALTIDHIDGNGWKHRRELGACNLYSWLKRNGYPTGFQVLCMNCQFIKRIENHECVGVLHKSKNKKHSVPDKCVQLKPF